MATMIYFFLNTFPYPILVNIFSFWSLPFSHHFLPIHILTSEKWKEHYSCRYCKICGELKDSYKNYPDTHDNNFTIKKQLSQSHMNCFVRSHKTSKISSYLINKYIKKTGFYAMQAMPWLFFKNLSPYYLMDDSQYLMFRNNIYRSYSKYFPKVVIYCKEPLFIYRFSFVSITPSIVYFQCFRNRKYYQYHANPNIWLWTDFVSIFKDNNIKSFNNMSWTTFDEYSKPISLDTYFSDFLGNDKSFLDIILHHEQSSCCLNNLRLSVPFRFSYPFFAPSFIF